MDQRINRHRLGFWEISEKPTSEELGEYYAKKYYQEAQGSYELEYSEQELLYFRAKLKQRHAVLKPYLSHLDGGRGKFLDV